MIASPTLDDYDRSELQAHRAGIGHLAEDSPHAGQPVHEVYVVADAESTWWLQITHADIPLWNCMSCAKLTLGPAIGDRPKRCVACGDHPDSLIPVLYPQSSACRSWTKNHGGQYDGPCLIAGSDGCDCDGDR